MTDLEHQLMRQLITAAWPLPWQIAFAVTMVGGYGYWSRLYFRTLDRRVRMYIGQRLGVHIRWVQRHTAGYQTPFASGLERYFLWSWGIEEEHRRTVLRDGLVASLCFVVVNLASGLWPLVIFFLVALQLKALSALIFIPALVAVVGMYAVFWAGRYEVAGMRDAAPPLHDT